MLVSAIKIGFDSLPTIDCATAAHNIAAKQASV